MEEIVNGQKWKGEEGNILNQQLRDLKLGDFNFKDVFNEENEGGNMIEGCNEEVKKSLEKLLDEDYMKEQGNGSMQKLGAV